MGKSNIEILSNINSQIYQERIPSSTQTNLEDIANTIMNYAPLKNEVLTEVINKIAFSIIRGIDYEGIFSRFRGEDIVYGDTIEEIQITMPSGYDPRTVSTDPFAKVQPSVKACYHTINSEMQYCQTVTDADFRRAVRSANGLDTLINNIIASMTSAMMLDDDLKCIEVLSNRGVYGQIVYMGAETGNSETDAKTLVTAIKNVGSAMKHASNEWNFLRILRQLPLNRQILIIRSDWKDKIDLDYLSGVYNLNKVEIAQRIVEIESFIGLDNAVACLIDERALMFHKALQDGGMMYNPKGVPYTNHFLNSWGVYSFSLFLNSALFVFADAGEITLTVQSTTDTPINDYVVKDSDNRIMTGDNGSFTLSEGTYTVYADGYQSNTFTVSASDASSETPVAKTVSLTANA